MSTQIVNLGIAPVINFETLELNAAADISLATAGLDFSNFSIEVLLADLCNAIVWNSSSLTAEVGQGGELDPNSFYATSLINALRNLAENSAKLTIKDNFSIDNSVFSELFTSDDVSGARLFPGDGFITTILDALKDDGSTFAPLILLGNELVEQDETRASPGGLFVANDVYPFNALIKNGSITVTLDEPSLNGNVNSVTLFEEIALGTTGAAGTIPTSSNKYSTDGDNPETTVDTDDGKGIIVRMALKVVSTLSS